MWICRSADPSSRSPRAVRTAPWLRPVGRSAEGLTLIELMLALLTASILLMGLGQVVGESLHSWSSARERNDLTRQARFAMDRMIAAVRGSERLILPLAENSATAYSESVRDVLAVLLDPTLDRDSDGFADADNDKDGLVDEDPGFDQTNDGASGIVGIDDDNDGLIDESSVGDDDEDEDQTGAKDEETLNGVDDDADGAVDEDLHADLNQDGAAGVLGVDDDGDALTDESSAGDDDEDEDDRGTVDEDWRDAVVYRLSGTTLLERFPNINPVDGSDYTESPIADNVSLLRVERLPSGPNDRAVLIDLTLELSGPLGATVSLNSRVRVGGAP